MVKNLPANAGNVGDVFDPWVRKTHPRGGNDNPLQRSYLGNPMDRGTGGLQPMESQSQTRLSN